jgi:hypothetical protein
MITGKQAEARRRNGRLSRGPKTPEGKAIVSRNALKYGLLSSDPVAPGDSLEEFAAFREEYLKGLRPVRAIQKRLAEQIVADAWRLSRIPRIEAEIYGALFRTDQRAQARRLAWVRTFAERPGANHQALAALEASASPEHCIGRAFIRDRALLRGRSVSLSSLHRYEVVVNRSFSRNLDALKRLQQAVLQNKPTKARNVIVNQ